MRTLIACLLLTACLSAAPAPLAVAASQGSGTAAVVPNGAPPTDLSWFRVPVYGGDVEGLVTLPSLAGGQRLIAVGPGAYASGRGDSWTKAKSVYGPVKRVTAGDGAVYVSGPGDAKRQVTQKQGFTVVTVRGRDEVRFVAVSPNHRLDGQALAITVSDWRMYRGDAGRSLWNEVVIEREGGHQIGSAVFSPMYAVDDTLFAGTEEGLFRSEDTGQRWSLVASESAPLFGPEAGSIDHQGLVISPEFGDDPRKSDDPVDGVLWAYNDAGIFRTDNAGADWERLPIAATHVNGLAVNPAWPRDRTIGAALEDEAGNVAAVSHDGGDTWTKVPGHHGLKGTSIAFATDYTFGFPNRSANAVYMPSLLNGGRPGVPSIVPAFEGSFEIYISTDGDGVWRSRDAGVSWTRVVNGLDATLPTSVTYLPGGPEAPVFVGTGQSGLYASRDGGRHYRPLPSPLPMGAGQSIDAIAPSPAFGTDRTLFVAAASGVWRSPDSGTTWEHLASAPAPALGLAFSPRYASDGTLAVPGAISHDRGDTWQAMGDLPGIRAVAFAADYGDEHQALWAGNDVGTFQSSDDGAEWEQHDASSLRSRGVYEILVLTVPNTVDPPRIFVATDRGVVGSLDDGVKFNSLKGTSGDVYGLVAATFSQPAGAVVFGAGTRGAMYSTDRGDDWTRDAASPLDATAAGIASNGEALLLSTAGAVFRYGEASGRVFLPEGKAP